jgi:hypothetical protein
MLALFQVLVLELGNGAFIVSDVTVRALASVKWVTGLEGAEKRGCYGLFLLFRECKRGAVSGEMRVEGGSLTDIVYKWCVAVQDFVVLFGIFCTSQILLAFIGVKRVTNSVHVGEWFRNFGVQESLR